MNDDRDPLEQRLRQALPTDVPDDTRARHLAALDGALGASRSPRLGWRHRLGGMLAAAATALTPVGVAVAAEGATPGDALYPVKQVTERIQALVRDEVVLEHRVEELDALLRRDASEDDLVAAVDRGVDAALDQPDEPELQERLAGLALEAATRVRDTDRLALDRLPTRRPPVTDRPTTDRHSPSTRPSPSDRPTSERPSPDPTPSDRPTADPSISPSPRPSPSPLPADSEPPSDRQPLRTERHEAGDAGVVFIDVYRDGIRVAGVRVADGWEHRVDRSHEPETSLVGFRSPDRQVVLVARWRDGQVHIEVDERDRTTDDRATTSDTR